MPQAKFAKNRRVCLSAVLTTREVMARTGIKERTLFNRIRAGTFPAPIALGYRLNRWPLAEVEKWLDDQTAREVEAWLSRRKDAEAAAGCPDAGNTRAAPATSGRCDPSHPPEPTHPMP